MVSDLAQMRCQQGPEPISLSGRQEERMVLVTEAECVEPRRRNRLIEQLDKVKEPEPA